MCRYQSEWPPRAGLSIGADSRYAWSRANAMRMSLMRALAPNSTLLSDAYTSPLRAQHGAAKRER
jgi:hypothetical protein